MALYCRRLSFILIGCFLAACTVVGPLTTPNLPANPTPKSTPLASNTYTPSPAITSSSTPSPTVTATPDFQLRNTAYEKAEQTILAKTEQAYEATAAVEYNKTSTAIVHEILATITPAVFQEFLSPDGKWKAQLILYGCAQITTEEGYTQSYEVLKILHTVDATEREVDRQLLYCGGLGAAGLGGLLWSPNSRFFYYTTAREGVPDGTGGFGFMRPVSRFDVTTGKRECVGGAFSPDQNLIAGGQGTDLVVWMTDGDEVVRFPSPKVENGWINYLAWSPDGERIAYLIQVSSVDSMVMIANLITGEVVQVPLTSVEQMWEVRWISNDQLGIASLKHYYQWQYDLFTGQVSSLATPTPVPPGYNNLVNRVIDLSSDGRQVLFQSNAPSLPGAAFPKVQTYLFDRVSAGFERIPIDRNGFTPTDLSPEGRYIIYSAQRETSTDPGDATAVYLLDRQNGQSELISVGDQGQLEPGERGKISGDGRFVVFVSQSTHLTADPVNGDFTSNVFLRDRYLQKTILLSKGVGGAAADEQSYAPAITPDGRYVAFLSVASNLIANQVKTESGLNRTANVFVYDRLAETLQQILIPIGEGEGGAADTISLSDDGRWVAFHMKDPQDGAYPKVVIYDRQSGTSEWLCAQEGNDCTGHSAQLSGDGRFVAFNAQQTYLYDRQTRQLTLVSKTANGAAADGASGRLQGWAYASDLRLSQDGRWIAFSSEAANLLPAGVAKAGCTNFATQNPWPCRDLFLYDRDSDQLKWIGPDGLTGIK